MTALAQRAAPGDVRARSASQGGGAPLGLTARVALALAMVCAACDGESEPAPSIRAGNPRRMGRTGAPQARVQEPQDTWSRVGPRSRSNESGPRIGPRATNAPAPRAEPEQNARPREVDYGAMLQRAFGVPTDCFSQATRRAPSGTLTMNVTVSVMGSGRVTRATVSSSRLSEEEIECMVRRAERLYLPAPIPDAPRTISTAIEYQLQSEAAQEERREVEPQENVPGRVAPDRTLQGAGTETGRPQGSVPPSSTLPAQAP